LYTLLHRKILTTDLSYAMSNSGVRVAREWLIDSCLIKWRSIPYS